MQLSSLGHVLFAGFTHKPGIMLAKEIIALTGGRFNKIFFSDNGSTAVEIALKMSFQYWHNSGMKDKKKFLSLDCGYHGDTVGAMSVSGVDAYNEIFSPLFFESYKAPSPYCYRCPVGRNSGACNIDCIKPMENILRANSGRICAIILEPLMLGAGGIIVYPREYLKKVALLAKKYKVHLILDEVATGFGRTGKMFAYQHVQGIRPDFLCISKGITSGYLPFAATLTTDKIYKAFYAPYEKGKTFFHGHTYTGNPVSCSAALASLKIFKDERTLAKANKLAKLFHRELENFKSLPFVGDVRYIGLIGAIELVKDKKSKKRFSPKKRLGFKIYQRSLKENIVLRPLGDVIYLFLPLCIKKRELEDILRRARKVIYDIPKILSSAAD
jgi:adenosylmethionine-8-amino-7-oxononanoate aminotransferase